MPPCSSRADVAATRAYALAALSPAAPAFARRQDARFVGRVAELDTLSSAFRSAAEDAAGRSVLVVGPAGSGKSRLAAEFARRLEAATILRGRCLSYGERITYEPLREAFRQAPESERTGGAPRRARRRHATRPARGRGRGAALLRGARARAAARPRARRPPLGGAGAPRAGRRRGAREARVGSWSSASGVTSCSRTPRRSSPMPSASCSTRSPTTDMETLLDGSGRLGADDRPARSDPRRRGRQPVLPRAAARARAGGPRRAHASDDDPGAAGGAARPAGPRGARRSWSADR